MNDPDVTGPLEDGPRAEAGPFEILHLDDQLVAVTKPGGILVHRTREARRDRVFLLQELSRQVGQTLYPVHRLDRATSGTIVFGLNSRAARHIHDSLKEPESRKEYLALVRGSTPDRWDCDRPLTNKHGERQETRSAFAKIAEFSRLSLLRVRIFTGRRHQIRRHLHHAAHQILGDTTYGKGRINRFFREEYGLPRMFLHAARLRFSHPETNDWLTLDSRLPEDLRTFLLELPDCDPELVESL